MPVTKPDLTFIDRVAVATNPDPCDHISVQSRIADGWNFATQGQTQAGQPMRWEAVDVGNTANDVHAEVGDYIVLQSGPQAGDFREVTSVVSSNRLELAAAWSVDQGPVDFAIAKRIKTFTFELHISELWNAIPEEDLKTTELTLLRQLARQTQATPSGSRPAVINKLNANTVKIEAI